MGIGGVRGAPPTVRGGWGGLEVLHWDRGGTGGSGGLSGSTGAGRRALVSCCRVSGFILKPMAWDSCAVPIGALLDWSRLSRTANWSWVSCEFGPFGSKVKSEILSKPHTDPSDHICIQSTEQNSRWIQDEAMAHILVALQERYLYIQRTAETFINQGFWCSSVSC